MVQVYRTDCHGCVDVHFCLTAGKVIFAYLICYIPQDAM